MTVPVSDHKETARILQDAAALLEREGWVQYSLHRPGEGYCAMGALSMTQYGRLTGYIGCDASAALYRTVQGSVAAWNDDPARTKQEVLDAFHRAAKAELRLADGEVS